MGDIFISGTGLWTPEHSVSNEELVESFNSYVALYNEKNKDAITSGDLHALEESSCEFIVKASGIENRYVIEKDSLLNPEIMKPMIPAREDGELSVQAEICVIAANAALEDAGLQASDIDAVIDVVMSVVDLITSSEIIELDINPLLVMTKGDGAIAVDALVKLN